MDKVEMALDVPKAMRERQGALLGLDGLPAGMASDMVGMGSWRLRNSVDESIGFMIGRLEGLLREMLEDDLTLYPPEQWKVRENGGRCRAALVCPVGSSVQQDASQPCAADIHYASRPRGCGPARFAGEQPY